MPWNNAETKKFDDEVKARIAGDTALDVRVKKLEGIPPIDTTSDAGGDLRVTVTSAVDRAVSYTISGLDPDAKATVTFTDKAGTKHVEPERSANGAYGMAVPAALVYGAMTVSVTAKDAANPAAVGAPALFTMTQPVIPPGTTGIVASQHGPMNTVAQTTALGGVFAKYEADFKSGADQWWNTEAARWEGNYYDRGKICYAWSERETDATRKAMLLDRGNKITLAYRAYLESINYVPSAHWTQPAGLALHFLFTKDDKSRLALERCADGLALPYYMTDLGGSMDHRIQARCLQHFTYMNKLGPAKSPFRMTYGPGGEEWGDVGSHEWSVLAKDALNKIINGQNADGSPKYRGQMSPFMFGLRNDALIEFFELFEKDARILPTVKKNLDWMWGYWDDNAKAFEYDVAAPVGPAPDLNNLIVSGFAWVAKQSGDAAYMAKADKVFAGGVNGAWLGGSKQFNQQYTNSFKYLALRA